METRTVWLCKKLTIALYLTGLKIYIKNNNAIATPRISVRAVWGHPHKRLCKRFVWPQTETYTYLWEHFNIQFLCIISCNAGSTIHDCLNGHLLREIWWYRIIALLFLFKFRKGLFTRQSRVLTYCSLTSSFMNMTSEFPLFS